MLSDAEPIWLATPTLEHAKFLDQLGRLIGTTHTEGDLNECIAMLAEPQRESVASGRLAILAGLADGLARTPESLRKLLTNPPEALKAQLRSLAVLLDIAVARAKSAREKTPERVEAVRILAKVTPEFSGTTLLNLLQPQQPAEVQSAAARGLADLDSPALAKTLFSRCSQYAAATRRSLLASVPRSTALTAALAGALQNREVAAVELDASVRQALLRTSSDPLRQQFQRLFATAIGPDRQEVISRFQPSLKLDGDRARCGHLHKDLSHLPHHPGPRTACWPRPLRHRQPAQGSLARGHPGSEPAGLPGFHQLHTYDHRWKNSHRLHPLRNRRQRHSATRWRSG
jgi:hypothetical protein